MENQNVDAELLVRYYKFYFQDRNPYLKFKLYFEKIKTKAYYTKYKKVFDKLLKIIIKYNINCDKYIKYCVIEQGIRTPNDLLDIRNFKLYAENLKIEEQYKNIYKYYMKSANNIADECIARNMSAKEYIASLVVDNKLAYEYTTGTISKYFLASIQNFKKIYERMDLINREEMGIIYTAAEELNELVQNVFLKFTNRYVKPMELTEQIINKKLKTKLNKQTK